MMKEFEKLLLEENKRKETEKALREIQLGLFEQKKEEAFPLQDYTLMTYENKKYKGLYDLYCHNENKTFCYVCPLTENDKEDETKDIPPYAYDVIYLESLTDEQYEQVKAAAVHENSKWIDIFFKTSVVLYIVMLLVTIILLISVSISQRAFVSVMLVMGPIISMQVLYTVLLPILMILYRNYKGN